MRAFWSWLLGRRKPPEPPHTPHYTSRDDPLVRKFRTQRVQAERAASRAERALRRRTGNPIEDAMFGGIGHGRGDRHAEDR